MATDAPCSQTQRFYSPEYLEAKRKYEEAVELQSILEENVKHYENRSDAAANDMRQRYEDQKHLVEVAKRSVAELVMLAKLLPLSHSLLLSFA